MISQYIPGGWDCEAPTLFDSLLGVLVDQFLGGHVRDLANGAVVALDEPGDPVVDLLGGGRHVHGRAELVLHQRK